MVSKFVQISIMHFAAQRTKFVAAAMLATAIVTGIRPADAGTVTMTYVSHPGNAAGVNVYLANNPLGNPIGLSQGGAFLWNLGTVSLGVDEKLVPNTTNAGQILTFCLQLTSYIPSGSNTYNASAVELAPDSGIGSPMGKYAADLISLLWAAHIKDVTTLGTAAQKAVAAAAFQLAVWEIEYDHGASSASGDYFTDPSTVANNTGILTAKATNSTGTTVLTTAKNWINDAIDAYKNKPLAPRADLYALTLKYGNNTYAQDQLVEYEKPEGDLGHPVPEPVSMAIWLVVGAVFAYPKLRRRDRLANVVG